MRRAALAVTSLALLLAACSTRAPRPGASGSPTRSATARPSASSTKKPAHVVSARQALYIYQNAIWLYDVKTNKTRQVTQGGTVSMPKWIDGTRFSFVQGGNTLRIGDLKAATTTDVFTAPGGIQVYGWSPDAQTVAYVETDSSAYPHLRYRSLSDGATQSVATLARALGRGAVQSDDLRLQFSSDGRYVLVVFTPADGDSSSVPPDQSQFQIRGADGSLAFSVDMSRDPTMGLFARDGKTAYYMDSGGVRAWTASQGSARTLRTMQWFDPWQSPDGTRIAFDTGSYSTKARVKVLDLRALTVTTISRPGRARPMFAGPTTLWVEAVVRCPDVCDGPTFGGVYSIDTRTKTERRLPVETLEDVDVFYS